MTIEINGININEIKDVQDVLAAFLALQLETEKSIEEIVDIYNKGVEIFQACNNTHLNVQVLKSSMQEIQKKQEQFIKNQRIEQNNLINTEELIQKTNDSLNVLRSSLEEIEERTNKLNIFSKVLGGLLFVGGALTLWVYKEAIISFWKEVFAMVF